MTEERITESRDELGNTHTTHTVVTGEEPRKSSTGTIVLLLILAALAIGAFVIYNQVSDSEVAANDAVTDAAGQVGEAASEVGGAAQDAVDKIDGE